MFEQDKNAESVFIDAAAQQYDVQNFDGFEPQERTNFAAQNPEDGDGATEQAPYKTFKTKAQFQNYFDDLLGRRLGERREREQRAVELSRLLSEKYGTDEPRELETLLAADGGEPANLSPEIFSGFEAQLNAEIDKLKQVAPGLYDDIDAGALTQNSIFVKMLANGITLEGALAAMNIDTIGVRIAEQAADGARETLRSARARIAEGAIAPSQPASVIKDPAKMSRGELDSIIERANKGEQITF